jgi:hypothetical protein
MPAVGAAQAIHHAHHRQGIVAHIAIWLEPGVDIFGARKAFLAGARPVGFDISGVHIGLGEIDCLADVSCKWTKPRRGYETRRIGEWINDIRQLTDANGRLYVRRTSTVVCMNMP